MKNISLLLLVIVMVSSKLNAQNNTISAFLLKWENSKNYLLEIAEAMPEEKYDFKPTEREMSFEEQLLHIRENMAWLSESYFTGHDFVKSEKINPTGKTEIIKELRVAFDKVSEIIDLVSLDDLSTEVKFIGNQKSKLQILNLLQDHVTHHRGQLIVYLNLNAIVPPKYIGW
jgi:uncharacterized damage-inducible protein DinB